MVWLPASRSQTARHCPLTSTTPHAPLKRRRTDVSAPTDPAKFPTQMTPHRGAAHRLQQPLRPMIRSTGPKASPYRLTCPAACGRLGDYTSQGRSIKSLRRPLRHRTPAGSALRPGTSKRHTHGDRSRPVDQPIAVRPPLHNPANPRRPIPRRNARRPQYRAAPTGLSGTGSTVHRPARPAGRRLPRRSRSPAPRKRGARHHTYTSRSHRSFATLTDIAAITRSFRCVKRHLVSKELYERRIPGEPPCPSHPGRARAAPRPADRRAVLQPRQ